MSRAALSFAWSVVLLGGLAFVCSLRVFATDDIARFVTLALFGLIASQIKFRVPGAAATLTTNLLVFFICILELSAGETAVVAAVSTIVQTYYHTIRKPTPLQFLFNLGALNIAITGASIVFRQLSNDLPVLGLPGSLAFTGGAFFLLNTAPVSIIQSLTEGGGGLSRWRTSYTFLVSFYVAGICVAGIMHFLAARYGWQVVFLILPLFYTFGKTYQVFLGRLEDTQLHNQQLTALQLRSMHALAQAVEAKDETTHSHLHRVQTYALALGSDMGLSDTDLKALQAASILHDVGKLAVPEHIISKPGKLTSVEFEQMKMHTVVGGDIVEQMSFPFPVAPLVRGHHEKWDGSGYPDGLAGEAIPLGARILAVVDCFDALVKNRQYRRAMPLDQAIGIVQQQSGKAFDPTVTALLVRRYAELEEKARTSFEEPKFQAASRRVVRGDAPDAGLEVPGVAGADSGIDRLRSVAAAYSGIRALTDSHGAASVGSTAAGLSVILQGLVPHAALVLFEKRDQKLAAVAAVGDEAALLGQLAVPLGQGLTGWVGHNCTAMVNGNPQVDSGAEGLLSLRAALVVPIQTADGLAGVIGLYRRERDSFDRRDLGVLEAVAPRLSRLVSQTVTDTAREVGFLEALQSICGRADDSVWRLVRIDVAENSAEDLVQHFQECLPETAIVGRLGRAEFGVLLHPEAGEWLSDPRISMVTATVRLAPGMSAEGALALAESSIAQSREWPVVEGLVGLQRSVSEVPAERRPVGGK